VGIVIIEISKLVYEGYGLGFHEGNTYFVLNALPGDVVKVQVLYKKKNSFFCEIVEVLKPSRYRGSIRCDISNVCGACDWVNIDYAKQIELKSMMFRDIYKRENIEDIEKSPTVDYYRNKCFFPVKSRNDKAVIGMYSRGTHEIVEHRQCFLYPDKFAKMIDVIKEWIVTAKVKPYDEVTHLGDLRHIGFRATNDLKSIIIILVTRTRKLPFTNQLVNSLTQKFPEICGIVQNVQNKKNNAIMGNDDKILYGNPYFIEILDDKSFKIHYKAFYQVNIKQAVNIYNEIARHCSNNEVVIDAYSGIGIIGSFVSSKAKKVFCIEENPDAINCGKECLKMNDINNIVFSDLGDKNEIDEIKNILSKNTVDTIIFDPPRKGIDKKIIKLVSNFIVKKIIYMSCNPVTQLRDIELFIKQGYILTLLKGYDMFPHTWHIETLGVLRFDV